MTPTECILFICDSKRYAMIVLYDVGVFWGFVPYSYVGRWQRWANILSPSSGRKWQSWEEDGLCRIRGRNSEVKGQSKTRNMGKECLEAGYREGALGREWSKRRNGRRKGLSSHTSLTYSALLSILKTPYRSGSISFICCLWLALYLSLLSTDPIYALHFPALSLRLCCCFVVHVDGVRRCLRTSATIWPTAYPPSDIGAWRAMVEWYWQGNSEKLGEKPVQRPLCLP
jgi:hypothetical protein